MATGKRAVEKDGDDDHVDDEPNEYDLNDSLIDDEEEECEPTDEDSDWEPSSEDEGNEDVETLLQGSQRFVKTKKELHGTTLQRSDLAVSKHGCARRGIALETAFSSVM